MIEFLYPYQLDAVKRMSNGCILNGGVGSGKSRTGLYYYMKLFKGAIDPKFKKMTDPVDLYIITTAKKRDSKEWDIELAPFMLSTDPELNGYENKVVIDSWNNIKKYKEVENSFFIFDEDRVTGTGAWVKAFLKIAKHNQWIILSATPGDTWYDYLPVFIANGFFESKREFNEAHVVFSPYTNYPKIDRYLDTTRLIRLRNKILVDMDYKPPTKPHHEYIYTQYDTTLYKRTIRESWDFYKDEPILQASSMCYALRKICNLDQSRQVAVLELFEKHPRMIIFYNFDYELEELKNLYWGEWPDVEIAEWNGHKHQEVPDSKRWVYFVNYNAGAEGWNCITTDTIVFYSQNYSYKILAQSAGRINRLNSPYTDLYYYHLLSRSGIDLAIYRALQSKKKFQ